jgi:hypothetical protein
MKKLILVTAVGALLLGVAWPAMAQQQPAFNVTFSGQFRFAGIAFNNLSDFADTKKAGAACSTAANNCKDSASFLHERFRLYTTIESADKMARVVWALEVGDVIAGGIPGRGGASGAEYGGTSTRTAQNCCGGLGADAVSVETKNVYLWIDTGKLVPGTSVLFGTHNIVLLNSPVGAFMDDDGTGIQLNWKSDVADVQLYMVQADENDIFNADDNTMYAARVGVNVTKDMRFTLEGMVVDAQCYARRAVPLGSPVGTLGSCVHADFGDTYWIGATAAVKVANVNLDGQFVYGQRKLFCSQGPLCGKEQIKESGYGLNLSARVPFGPLSTWFNGWYTTGDKNRLTGGSGSFPSGEPVTPAGGPGIPGGGPAPRVTPGPCSDFTTVSNSTRLCRDSDKLPIPIAGASWLGAPFVGEALNHSRTTGNISSGQPLYNDWTGTWGVGGSVVYALTPAVSFGGGVAFVGPTEDKTTAGGDNSIFGKYALEIDGGAMYQFNPQLSFQVVGSYIFADKGDDAWALYWRSLFAF